MEPPSGYRRRLGGWSRLYILLIAFWGFTLYAIGLYEWWIVPGASFALVLAQCSFVWVFTSLLIALAAQAIRWVARGFEQP